MSVEIGSPNSENGLIEYPYWLITTGTKKVWYVSRSPNLKFTDKLDEAVRFTRSGVMEALDIIATMQESSIYKSVDSYTMVCIKGPNGN